MSGLYIEGIGVIAPGIDDWSQCGSLLRGESEYQARPYVVPHPKIMTDATIRRANAQIRLGVSVATQAVTNAGVKMDDLSTVFTASEGDGITANEVCSTVTGTAPSVSPTRFHNSVHNASAGNWAIATHCQAPSVSLAAYDGSFTAGLIEACAQARVEARPVLLATHDTKGPPVLDAIRPLHTSFGVAMVLTPARGPKSLASLNCRLVVRRGQESALQNPALESIRTGNPAARALPLLALVARGEGGIVFLPFTDTHDLEVEITPCS